MEVDDSQNILEQQRKSIEKERFRESSVSLDEEKLSQARKRVLKVG